MSSMRRAVFMTSIFLAADPQSVIADCAADAMVVFDGSGSMAEVGFNQIDEPRIFEAREAVARVAPEVETVRDIGLLIYGPGGADGCTGLDVRFAPQPLAAEAMIAAINALEPTGDTALTDAVQMAANVLDYRTQPGTVVLVTDGKETCGGAPCTLAAELAADGADLTVHVIGFRVRGEHFAWQSQGDTDYSVSETVSRCLADRTGGLYVSAESVDDLIAALRQTLGCNVLF